MRPLWSAVFALVLVASVRGSVVQLTSDNLESTLNENTLVFISFSADWCRFSQALKPIFAQAAEAFAADAPGTVAFATVDCDRQPAVAQKYHVNKYPTLKLVRAGQLVKKEYRGQRSADALKEFIRKQLQSTTVSLGEHESLNEKLDTSKRNIIGYFAAASGADYANFDRLASALREDCAFYTAVGEWTRAKAPSGSALEFRPPNQSVDVPYGGPLSNYELLRQWAHHKCVPVIREITFENAEELTEEGLPFVILFRHRPDAEAEKVYTNVVLSELQDLKSGVNFLMADGKQFAHPLYHLGKTERDLPVIAIDSFRHCYTSKTCGGCGTMLDVLQMYLFSDFNDIKTPGRLRQFVEDLHSGKLHREFHHGPDPSRTTTPPSSIFKQLKPSDSRYSLLNRDEL